MAFKDPNRKREYHHNYYAKYYAENVDRERRRIGARKAAIRAWYKELKSRLACNRCGENHPACLQFHHRNGEAKELTLSLAIHNGWSIKRLEAEIAKCEVLCANCHFKEHYDWAFVVQEQESA
jgi:hypothetical protein